jgi:hypothetical protein
MFVAKGRPVLEAKLKSADFADLTISGAKRLLAPPTDAQVRREVEKHEQAPPAPLLTAMAQSASDDEDGSVYIGRDAAWDAACDALTAGQAKAILEAEPMAQGPTSLTPKKLVIDLRNPANIAAQDHAYEIAKVYPHKAWLSAYLSSFTEAMNKVLADGGAS